MSEERLKEYLRMAEEYHKKGLELFAEKDYADAAEKIWASIKTATMALTEKYLGRIMPKEGEYWRDFITSAFLKAGLVRKEAEKRAEYFIDVREKLHGSCFYGLLYEEIEHKPLIDASREYLNEIWRLLFER